MIRLYICITISPIERVFATYIHLSFFESAWSVGSDCDTISDMRSKASFFWIFACSVSSGSKVVSCITYSSSTSSRSPSMMVFDSREKILRAAVNRALCHSFPLTRSNSVRNVDKKVLKSTLSPSLPRVAYTRSATASRGIATESETCLTVLVKAIFCSKVQGTTTLFTALFTGDWTVVNVLPTKSRIFLIFVALRRPWKTRKPQQSVGLALWPKRKKDYGQSGG